ncbi:hypothetical protein FBQ96_05560 [Nitrospirales bacterium NOB]|nr:MAG: hypothetical protein UZ03_NOB001001796 [Nitrospira sp. OLB3]MBV6469169.1 hypothetical protein [Nitrospirota bacterium]MCE7965781.1 hypothetical protein [Nitrospira sp. NTP2]MCK6494246.1 hypothetical protein [Nitrospira sp.]MDL1889038.1 hypothetical protein [Nitrospirales bacterium NOB]MEB2340117.1 hypothetical protein [Nitrospirales bacterium]
MPLIWIGTGLLFALLSACAEGRWVQAGKTDAQTQEDWDQCKAEVFSGVEHQKDTMAGGVNLSRCMQSKGYRYVEDHPPQGSGPETPSSPKEASAQTDPGVERGLFEPQP